MVHVNARRVVGVIRDAVVHVGVIHDHAVHVACDGMQEARAVYSGVGVVERNDVGVARDAGDQRRT